MLFLKLVLLYLLLVKSAGHSLAKRQSTDVSNNNLLMQVKLLENKVSDLKRSIARQCNNNSKREASLRHAHIKQKPSNECGLSIKFN